MSQPKKKSDEDPAHPSFEEALAQLESLVVKLEKGDLTLEESLQSFEKGVSLMRTCQQALSAAEQKVSILSSATPDAELDSFEGE